MGNGLINYHLHVCVFLFNFAIFAVYPVMTDIIMEALCPGEDECSLAIYITGLHQSITGIGSVFVIPVMGNLSDVYGRKALLTIPFVLCIIPLMILAYSRTTTFVYAYYVTKTLSAIAENSVQCLALAYVANDISEGKRGLLFGILIGVGSAGTLAGNLAARFLPAANIFQIAAIASVMAAVYLQLFLKDSTSPPVALRQPVMKTTTDRDEENCESLKNMLVFNTFSSFRNGIRFLKNSKTFMLAAFVAFFNMLAFGGLGASLFYYLKVRFQFNKEQFADISIIFSIEATITQLFVMPLLAPVLGDNILLSLGLSSAFIMMLLLSIAWSSWVPFVAALFCSTYFLATPALCSIISKQVGKDDQGMVQGFISSIASLANIVAPLIYSPLTALFLSEGAPFHYPGFSMLCIGLPWLIAFIVSTLIPAARLEATDNARILGDLVA